MLRQFADDDLRSALGFGLQLGKWRDEDLRAFSEFFSNRNNLKLYRWALETDRALWAEYCEKHLGTSVVKSWPRWNDVLKWQLRVRSSRKSWWRDNEEWLQRFFDEEISSINVPLGKWSPPQTRKFDVDQVASNDADLGLVFNFKGGGFREGAVYAHAINKLAGIGCALELCRRSTGEYPEQLEALVPRFMANLPNDPCGGKPFRYRRTAQDDYLLYSIGLNGKDDGGTLGGYREHPDWRWWAPRAK
jgi:hypothetical protein